VTAVPTLRVERALLRSGATVVCGVDEVGRGALGGPVTVGMVAIDATVSRSPAGVRDSKLLSPGARESLEPRIRRWARAHAVGHATAAEIDEVGIIAALRRAGLRAWAQLPVPVDVILLDGSHDWLTPPEQGSLFDDHPADPPAPGLPSVVTQVKADLTCTTVAAASVLAKTERDRVMVTLAGEHPGYGWEQNKGYASPEHLAALAHHGPCPQHRRSWRLPGGSAG
jgi:ribonuclease HII